MTGRRQGPKAMAPMLSLLPASALRTANQVGLLRGLSCSTAIHDTGYSGHINLSKEPRPGPGAPLEIRAQGQKVPEWAGEGNLAS